jgi:hypothetical protein
MTVALNVTIIFNVVHWVFILTQSFSNWVSVIRYKRGKICTQLDLLERVNFGHWTSDWWSNWVGALSFFTLNDTRRSSFWNMLKNTWDMDNIQNNSDELESHPYSYS